MTENRLRRAVPPSEVDRLGSTAEFFRDNEAMRAIVLDGCVCNRVVFWALASGGAEACLRNRDHHTLVHVVEPSPREALIAIAEKLEQLARAVRAAASCDVCTPPASEATQQGFTF